MTEKTMYERLGGRTSIEAVVDEFYDRVLADETVAHFFEGIDMRRQRAHQTQFLSSVAGGPVEYAGDEMAAAHAHLEIRPSHFEAIAGHMAATLEDFGVDEADREAVLEAMSGYEDAIVAAD